MSWDKVFHVDEDALSRQVDTLSEVTTHPEFIRALDEVRASSEDLGERVAAIEKYMNAKALAERGVPIPAGFRITPRLFENPRVPRLDELRKQLMTTLDPEGHLGGFEGDIAATVCASVGVGVGLTVCATVGGEV